MAIRIFQGRGIGDRSSFVLRGNAGDKGTVPIGSAPRQSPSLDLSLFFRLFEQALSSWWVPQLCWINRLSSLSSLWAIHVASLNFKTILKLFVVLLVIFFRPATILSLVCCSFFIDRLQTWLWSVEAMMVRSGDTEYSIIWNIRYS